MCDRGLGPDGEPSSGGFRGLAVFAFFYGAFYGGFVALLPALVMDYFGGRNISAIIGVLYTSVAFGTLVGPAAAGYAFDISRSYLLPILFSVGANLVVAAIMWSMSRMDARAKLATTGELRCTVGK